MKYLLGNRTITTIVFLVIILFTFSCNEKSPIEMKILGTWRIKRANVHSVFSFRANGSWTSSNRVEGRFSKIVENKGKLVGKWEVAASDEGAFSLIMTPVKVESVKEWEVGTAVQFEIVSVDTKEMKLIYPNGRKMKLIRVRGKKASAEEEDLGIVKMTTGPLIVNLKRDRAHSKFRYLCIDLELSVEDVETCDYIKIEKKLKTDKTDKTEEAEESIYHIHPKIREVAIMFFSSLTYKDTKTLNKVKGVVDNFKAILNPYLNGKLMGIDVVKVVVTTNRESVKEFENMYIPIEAEGTEAEEG